MRWRNRDNSNKKVPRLDAPLAEGKDSVPDDSLPVPDATVLPIDGILDLHTFNPKDIKDLIPEYIHECQKRGILQLRVIHGKGTGTLRRTVHAMLDRMPEVKHFRVAGMESGSWGATLVDLFPISKRDDTAQ
jgi:DNA-nicking Smr family endonuclease